MNGERQFHAYCVGAGKTGTHSIAGIFAKHFRAGHEAESEAALEMILGSYAARVPKSELEAFLLDRDSRLSLEMDSSLLNSHFIPNLVTLFPEAVFILTLRDPYSRVDSLYNHLLNESPPTGGWAELRRIGFAAERFPHEAVEVVLAERGLPSIDSVLHAYAQFFERAVLHIPADRLLVVRTDQIGASAAALARFLRIDPALLDFARGHEFASPRRFGMLAKVPWPFLQERVRLHCGTMLDAHFPELVALTGLPPRLAEPTAEASFAPASLLPPAD